MPRKNKNRRRPIPKTAIDDRLGLTSVNVRLFTEDVLEVKRLAAAQQIPWHFKLRTLLRDALRRQKAVVS